MKDINLIPKWYLEQKRLKKRKIKIMLLIAMLFLFLGCMVASPLYIKLNLTARNNKIAMSVKDTQQYAIIHNELTQINNIFTKREDIAKVLDSYGINMFDTLKRLEDDMPDKVFFTSLNYNGQKKENMSINIVGIAATEEDLASFVNYLRNEKLFKKVVLLSTEKKNTMVVKTNSGQSYKKLNNNKLETNIRPNLSSYFRFSLNIYF